MLQKFLHPKTQKKIILILIENVPNKNLVRIERNEMRIDYFLA